MYWYDYQEFLWVIVLWLRFIVLAAAYFFGTKWGQWL